MSNYKSQNYLWKNYYKNTEGIIFVVDSNDVDRIYEAIEEINKMSAEEELKDTSVLIMANKQDFPGAISPNSISEKLEMQSIKCREWLVQGTSATTGQGLKEGLDWMAKSLMKKK